MRNYFKIFILILTIWVIGFGYYNYLIYSYKANETHTDAIVVYTGGKDRIKIGVELLQSDYAPLLFISGVKSSKDLRLILEEQDINMSKVIFGLNAHNTKTNAIEIVDFIKKYNIKSIRLITSYYHMPRALLETNRLIHPAVLIIPTPVASKRSFKYLFNGYHKFIAAVILNLLT